MAESGSGFLKSAFLAVASCAVIHGLNLYIAFNTGFDFFGTTSEPIAKGIDLAVDGVASVFSDSATQTAATSLTPPAAAITPSSGAIPDIPPGCHIDIGAGGAELHCSAHEAPKVDWG